MFPQYKMSLPFSMSNTLNNCPQTVKKLQLLGNCCAEKATSVKCVWNNDCCSVTVMGCGFIYTWCITIMLPAVLGAELRFGWVQAAPQPSCKWVLWLFYASSLSGVWPECSLYFFRTSFTKRSISLSQQKSREKKFPKSLVRLPAGWRKRAMQLQQRYCCVQSGYQSAVTYVEMTTEADRTFVTWFLRASCSHALCTEQNKKLLQPWMFLQELQQEPVDSTESLVMWLFLLRWNGVFDRVNNKCSYNFWSCQC